MKVIRRCVFETNSSSTHSFTIGKGIYIEGESFQWKNKNDVIVESDLNKFFEEYPELELLYQRDGEESVDGYLIYGVEITSRDLNDNQIPELDLKDLDKLNKIRELVKQENLEICWQSAEYSGYE